MAIDLADITLGITSMDQEHHELAGLFDTFVECFQSRASLETIDALIEKGLALGNAHLEHEEQLMDETGFADAENHKLQHRRMRLEFTTLLGDILSYLQMHDPTTLRHLHKMRQILSEHIDTADRDVAAHLKRIGHS